ncbi:MAG: TetR/AcrR family transcriptional regulator [Flavobacteriaceae bacterium]
MPRQKQYSEEAVLNKAVDVFWRRGYKSASIRELEKEMGINQFSIYASFGSKKKLFLKALDRYSAQVKEIFLTDLIRSEGNISDIKKFMRSFVDSVQTGKTPNGCLMANTAMDMGSSEKEVKIRLNYFFDLLNNVFTEVLEKARIRNQITKNAPIEKYANFLVGCTEGLAVTAKVLDDDQLNDFIEITIATLK